MDTRDRPALQKLKENLEKKAKDIPMDYIILKRHTVSAYTAGSKWLKELDLLVKRRSLHLKPDHKYAEPLKLDKFVGYSDQKTNIYEFFKLYEIVSRGFKLDDKAHFLYSNYL